MISASSLFAAVPPFSEGTDSSADGTRAGSAADAFAALLAELDPADLQATLAAPVALASVPMLEDIGTLPDAREETAPLAPVPILLDIRAAGPSRAAGQKLSPIVSAEAEETPEQESFVDPRAFLLALDLLPVADRASLVPLCTGSATVIPEDAQAGIEAVPPSNEAVPASNEEDAGAAMEMDLGFPGIDTGTAPRDVQATDAPPVTPASAPLPKATGRVFAQESIDAPESSPSTRTDSVERRPVDLRQTLDENSRTPRTSRTSLTAASVPGDRPAPDVDAQQEIPRESETFDPLNVEGRWVQAVKRFVAQTAAAAETPTDARNTSPLPAERNTLTENARFTVRGGEDRLVALAQSPEPQSGNHDHSSQRGTAGSLGPHGPQLASAATSAVEFALTSAAAGAPVGKDAPLPDDADLARQIVQAAHLQWRNGGGEARLTLQPEYLGEVQISIRVESGTVTATMRAADPEVRAWMQTHESLLKQGLAEQGLRLDKLNVHDERDEREPGQDRQREPQDQPYRPQPARGTPPVFELTV